MDQEKIGHFLQAQRKQKNMTQKELADRIGVSDKTISKWEQGRSMPDISLLLRLCECLELRINDLLSGEKLEGGDFAERAESNMVSLLRQEIFYPKRIMLPFRILCFVLLVLAVVLILIQSFGITFVHYLGGYFDLMSLLAEVMIVAAVVGVSMPKTWSFALERAKCVVLPIGIAVSLFQMIQTCMTTAFTNMLDVSAFGVGCGIALLPTLYALILYVVFYLFL